VRNLPSRFVGCLMAVGMLTLLLTVGCATRIPAEGGFKESTLRAWYVPWSGGTDRKAVPYEHVEFLLKKPTDRKFRVIGYVMPTEWKLWYAPTREAIKAAKAAGSLYGADAVYFVDPEEIPNATKYTAAVIVWE